MKSARGFTLVELAVVLVMIGTLALLSVPIYESYVLRSRAAEPRTMLDAIAHAQHEYYRDYGKYIACVRTPEVAPRGLMTDFDGGRDGWRQLRFGMDGGVRYSYEVTLTADSFVVTAQGDLDGDGELSTFELDGRTLALTIANELE